MGQILSKQGRMMQNGLAIDYLSRLQIITKYKIMVLLALEFYYVNI